MRRFSYFFEIQFEDYHRLYLSLYQETIVESHQYPGRIILTGDAKDPQSPGGSLSLFSLSLSLLSSYLRDSLIPTKEEVSQLYQPAHLRKP